MEIRDSHDTHRLKWRPKSPTKFEFEDSLNNPESPVPPPTITTFPSLKGQLKSNPWNKDHAPLVDKSVSGVKQRFESQNLFKKPLPDVVRYGQSHESIMFFYLRHVSLCMDQPVVKKHMEENCINDQT